MNSRVIRFSLSRPSFPRDTEARITTPSPPGKEQAQGSRWNSVSSAPFLGLPEKGKGEGTDFLRASLLLKIPGQTRSSGVASRLTQEIPTAARADRENPDHLQAAGPNTGQAEEAWVRPVQAALSLDVTG